MQSKYNGEQVLVAPTSILRSTFPDFFQQPDSFTRDYANAEKALLPALYSYGRFMDRGEAEENPEFKQFIPYALIIQGGKVLVYTRGKIGAERKLHAKRSIGVGGHINPKDIEDSTDSPHRFELALQRELAEEIGVAPSQIISTRFVGIVNEDNAEVGRVHLGLVYVVEVFESVDFNFENCLLDAHFLTFAELIHEESFATLEGWSKLIAAEGYRYIA